VNPDAPHKTVGRRHPYLKKIRDSIHIQPVVWITRPLDDIGMANVVCWDAPQETVRRRHPYLWMRFYRLRYSIQIQPVVCVCSCPLCIINRIQWHWTCTIAIALERPGMPHQRRYVGAILTYECDTFTVWMWTPKKTIPSGLARDDIVKTNLVFWDAPQEPVGRRHPYLKQYEILFIFSLLCQQINRSHAHAHNSRTHDVWIHWPYVIRICVDAPQQAVRRRHPYLNTIRDSIQIQPVVWINLPCVIRIRVDASQEAVRRRHPYLRMRCYDASSRCHELAFTRNWYYQYRLVYSIQTRWTRMLQRWR